MCIKTAIKETNRLTALIVTHACNVLQLQMFLSYRNHSIQLQYLLYHLAKQHRNTSQAIVQYALAIKRVRCIHC